MANSRSTKTAYLSHVSTQLGVYEQLRKELYLKNYKIINHALELKNNHDKLASLSKQQLKHYGLILTQKIKQCDIFVAVIADCALLHGYEMSIAITHKKPIFLVVDLDFKNSDLAIIANTTELITTASGTNAGVVKDFHKFINKAQRGMLVKRVPIEFTETQVDYIEYKQFSGKKSFNASVREIVDEALLTDMTYHKLSKMLPT